MERTIYEIKRGKLSFHLSSITRKITDKSSSLVKLNRMMGCEKGVSKRIKHLF